MINNQILNEDVLSVLKRVPDNSFQVVYGDPDYNVGINYHGEVYTKSWETYIEWYIELAKESLRVLDDTGNMFFINYPKQNAYLRVNFLDKHAYTVHEYVWIYNTNVGHSPKRFTTAHRSILHATKSKNQAFYKTQVAVPYQNLNDKRIQKRISEGHTGRMPYSWVYFDLVKNVSKEKTDHPCQIPLGLFELLVKASSKEQDNVFILFGGSGNEIIRCLQLNRNFLSCEINPTYFKAIQTKLALFKQ